MIICLVRAATSIVERVALVRRCQTLPARLRVPGLFCERPLDFIGFDDYTRDFVKNTGFSIEGLTGNLCTLEHHGHIGKRRDRL